MNLKYWKHRILTLRKDLTGFFLISLVSVLLTDLWFSNLPEKFTGGSALLNLYYKICLAYITGFIFYFLNIHLQTEKNKVKTYKYIKNKTTKLNKLCDALILSLKDSSAHSSPFTNDQEEIYFYCNNVDPRKPFTLRGWYDRPFPHWPAGFEFIAQENRELTRDLLFVKESLHSDVVEIIIDLDDCIQNFINIKHGQPIGNSNLAVFSIGIIRYRELTIKLRETIREKYKFHDIEYSESLINKNNEK